LGEGVDVRGQTHVPARHFSLQSAYQSAGPGHSVTGNNPGCHAYLVAATNQMTSKQGWFPVEVALTRIRI
jgi:hypothetical protein